MVIEANKQHVKVHYDRSLFPRQYDEGDLVLLYDQAKEPSGKASLTPCGMVLISCNVFWKKEPMN
jgi:hypothetical protein